VKLSIQKSLGLAISRGIASLFFFAAGPVVLAASCSSGNQGFGSDGGSFVVTEADGNMIIVTKGADGGFVNEAGMVVTVPDGATITAVDSGTTTLPGSDGGTTTTTPGSDGGTTQVTAEID